MLPDVETPMSGFVGIVNLDGAPVDRELLDRIPVYVLTVVPTRKSAGPTVLRARSRHAADNSRVDH
jgi:hypothetical protein